MEDRSVVDYWECPFCRCRVSDVVYKNAVADFKCFGRGDYPCVKNLSDYLQFPGKKMMDVYEQEVYSKANETNRALKSRLAEADKELAGMRDVLKEAKEYVQIGARALNYQKPGKEFYPNREGAEGCLGRIHKALESIPSPTLSPREEALEKENQELKLRLSYVEQGDGRSL